ncbi:MAG: hypothetical protein KME64_42065 [Scytonematopsis contorta HA4267-MV1]|jgi:hypothetical protein|nr:hypothetical protein [Scytonematopsis contorta HA4267-MV1]
MQTICSFNEWLAGIHKNGEIQSEIYEFLQDAREADCIEASRRYDIIAPYLMGEKPESFPVPERTFYRWVENWRKALSEYGCGYIGLLPRKSRRGNRTAKLPLETQKLMDEFIASNFDNHNQKGKFAAYCSFKKACCLKGIMAPSYKTFVLNINKNTRLLLATQ